MEESVTYQEIIRKGVERGRVEGLAEGRVEGERMLLIRQCTAKFGPPDAASLARLEAIDDPQKLESLGLRLLHTGNWRELLEPEN